MYLNKIGNDIQTGNIQVSNAGIDVVSMYQELAHLNLSDTEKLVSIF
ncbi:MAG: hypothetical protein PG981_000366 [Wolbachia endosymbiont of Ctenocephalides orientis wCori]|nr:MAG: hypothetical protein PG981_000366 [Wolbachia endosymbiont of Ctenocephalides orientis wCori]